ncbi:hypothetical protein SCOR_22915 [Sulfidibacter corallicola]
MTVWKAWFVGMWDAPSVPRCSPCEAFLTRGSPSLHPESCIMEPRVSETWSIADLTFFHFCR